jgi:hypothetical protein
MRMYSLTSFLPYRSPLVVVQWKEELRILWIILNELSGSLSTMMVGKGETWIHMQGCEYLSRWYRALMWFLSPLISCAISYNWKQQAVGSRWLFKKTSSWNDWGRYLRVTICRSLVTLIILQCDLSLLCSLFIGDSSYERSLGTSFLRGTWFPLPLHVE